MIAALEPERTTMEFTGASASDLAVLQAQLDGAREAEPEMFQPDNDPAPQAAGESAETTGTQTTKPSNDAAPRAGTSEDTQKSSQPEAVSSQPDPQAEAEAAKPDPDAKPLSKFAKNQERLDKTWKGVNESKAAIAAERAEIEAQKAQFAKERQEWEAKASEQPQHSADEYEAAAKHWEKQGLLDQADAARAEAKRLRENPPKPRTPAASVVELEQGQRQSWQQVKQEIPEMFDAKHPLNGEMKAWLEQHGATHPVMKLAQGPHLIAHFLKAKADLTAAKVVSSRVPVLEQELAELKGKNQELERLVSVSGGGLPPGALKPRRFEEMSEQEQEDHIKQGLAYADR